MSAYSLEILNHEKYLSKYEDDLLCEFDKHWYKTYFKIGKGVEDFKKLKHSFRLQKVLETESCTLINYVQDKIDGYLGCTKKRKQKYTYTETYAQAKKSCPSGTNVTGYLSDCASLPWCEVEW